MMRLRCVPEIAAWMGRHDEDKLLKTGISHAEIFAGLAVMPEGKRRRDLGATAREMFGEFD